VKGRLSFAAWTLLAAGALGSTTPTPTPTSAARLSGGFGRPQATPAVTAPAKGQSLADVVKAASETRQGGTEAAKGGVSINNRNLVTDPNRGRLTTWQTTPRAAGRVSPAAAAPGKAATPAAEVPTPAPSPDPAEAEEAKWRETAAHSRQRVVDLKDLVSRLDGETKKLESDFYAWDDGQYRDNVIKPAWDKKREELETARRDLEEADRTLAELPEKARKAGALPGWIRE
jgi:hypothetical protein